MDHISDSLDLQDGLEFVSSIKLRQDLVTSNVSQLKDALTIHFKNIRDAGSNFEVDHAAILKDHINRIITGRLRVTEVPQVDAEGPAQLAELAVLPRAISRFAPRATLNPAPNWGIVCQPVSALS